MVEQEKTVIIEKVNHENSCLAEIAGWLEDLLKGQIKSFSLSDKARWEEKCMGCTLEDSCLIYNQKKRLDSNTNIFLLIESLKTALCASCQSALYLIDNYLCLGECNYNGIEGLIKYGLEIDQIKLCFLCQTRVSAIKIIIMKAIEKDLSETIVKLTNKIPVVNRTIARLSPNFPSPEKENIPDAASHLYERIENLSTEIASKLREIAEKTEKFQLATEDIPGIQYLEWLLEQIDQAMGTTRNGIPTTVIPLEPPEKPN